MDEETGLYYYGARYLDAKYSRWLSADPAVSDYIPMAPVDDEAKKHNQQLPGQGGVFNVVNFQLYHYAGNNPVKYTDPTGKSTAAMFIIDFSSEALTAAAIAGIITPEIASTVVGAIVLFALLLEDTDRIENALDKMDEANTSAQQADNVKSASPSPMPPDDGENEKQSDKQSTSSNQMNQQVKRGQAPKSVDRVDTANTNVKGEQDHIHFKDGNALNKDGSWKEGSGRPLTNAERKWITDNNWTLPTD